MDDLTIDKLFPLAPPPAGVAESDKNTSADRSPSNVLQRDYTIKEFYHSDPDELKTIQYKSKNMVAMWNGPIEVEQKPNIQERRRRRKYTIDVITPHTHIYPNIALHLIQRHSESIEPSDVTKSLPTLTPQRSTFPLNQKLITDDLETYIKNQGIEWCKSTERPVQPSSPIYLAVDPASMEHEHLYTVDAPEWIQDDVLDVSFRLIELITDCNKHKISILNSLTARTLFQIGNEEEQESLDDWAPDYLRHYKEEVKDLLKHGNDYDFIFIPINDGYKIMENVPEGGSHWTIVVVHCTRRATQEEDGHYLVRFFDSVNGGAASTSFEVAQKTVLGLRRVFESLLLRAQNLQMDATAIDPNCPNQTDMVKNKSEKSSACGPFLWAITNDMVRYLIFGLKAGKPSHALSIKLPEGFAQRFEFDSVRWRKTIKNLLARERRMRMAKTGDVDRTSYWAVEHLYPSFTRADGKYRVYPTPPSQRPNEPPFGRVPP